MAAIFLLRNNEGQNGNDRRVAKTQAEMLWVKAMQANDRNSKMAMETGRKRNTKLAKSIKWQRMVADK